MKLGSRHIGENPGGIGEGKQEMDLAIVHCIHA